MIQRPASSDRADLVLVLALCRPDRLKTILEQAAELGVREIRLVSTERSPTGLVDLDGLSGGLDEDRPHHVLSISRLEDLGNVLAGWEGQRSLMFCDEAGDAPPVLQALAGETAGPWAILIGPEDGFSPTEAEQVRALPFVRPVSLGRRVLRNDTAAIAAIVLWQASLGEWKNGAPPLSLGSKAPK
ncbi:MAG: RsmE family RNA methyltransferase [Caulobacteraceae bacterium]